MKTKIPCVILFYYNADIIMKTMEFLLKYSDRLDFYVLENRSPQTDLLIKPYMLELINQGKISKYVLFNKNITMNAYRMAFNAGLIPVANHEFIMLTDGDLIVPGGDFLTEQINILTRNRDVFACGVKLSAHNLPLNNYPGAQGWITGVTNAYADYDEAATGFHLTLFQTRDFISYLGYCNLHNDTIVDTRMLHFCYNALGKKWGRTRYHEAHHLTWDIYSDSQHPYQKWKSSVKLEPLIIHNEYCPYELFVSHSE